ncbi:hypothetical protein BKA57DRAFT_455875 [Linnemannia elongata]|nr:hypothetical protein BKA57DRAFT_455875 [Linnemannia elongata]
MRRRSPIRSRDVLFFLEVCASLQHFSAENIAVCFDDMLEHDDNDEDSEDHESQEGFVRSADGDGRDRRRIRRWACEGSLESLEIGFGLETTNPNDHRLVWAHLGRFRKLRSLTLGESNLIPSLKHGIDALVPLSVDGGGVNETMEKILSFGSVWTVSDRETILWIVRAFPRLTQIGLNVREGSTIEDSVRGWLEGVEQSWTFFTKCCYCYHCLPRSEWLK